MTNAEEHVYEFHQRDISWLSFNQRVLTEAGDSRLPVYERVNFMAIYANNLDEFFRVRIAELKTIVNGLKSDDTLTPQEVENELHEISEEIRRQDEKRNGVWQSLLGSMHSAGLHLYTSIREMKTHQREYISDLFNRDIFPLLQPVPLNDDVRVFLQADNIYITVRAQRYGRPLSEYHSPFSHFLIKLPDSNLYRRFITLPDNETGHHIVFLEDAVKMNIKKIFPGYEIESCHCFCTTRNSDIFVEDIPSTEVLISQIKEKVKRRKTGSICRFVYEKSMPVDILSMLCHHFNIPFETIYSSSTHLELQNLFEFPHFRDINPETERTTPMIIPSLQHSSMFKTIARQDVMLFYPYQSFSHFIQFLNEAANDEKCREIKLTQYRVAMDSNVVNTLIRAANKGKKVTVFVELKARFDEENNLDVARMMEAEGIDIIYSLPRLKVHAKVALVKRSDDTGNQPMGYAYIGTGNFNEETSQVYADCGMFTSRKEIVDDLDTLFDVLCRRTTQPVFNSLWITKFNFMEELHSRISREKDLVRNGKKGHIILKLNALQDRTMITELYKASEAGVRIDIIVRGICCLKTDMPYSSNIHLIRIIDTFLEHSRIYFFGNDGNPEIFFGSADWMKRNLYRRIECMAPVLTENCRENIIQMLKLQLADNTKACTIDGKLRNIPHLTEYTEQSVRAQRDFCNYLRERELKA